MANNKLTGRISPSIMCADFRHLEDSIRMLELAGVEYLHFDIMDGSFVPNFTFGPDLMQSVREITAIPFDIHLMVEHPESHIAMFNPQPGDLVSVHQEATVHLQRTLQLIRKLGASPGVALNPATSIHNLEDVLDDLDFVLIMTVNPGYAGQKLIPATIGKIARLRDYLDQNEHGGIRIEVDGNVSFENAVLLRQAGADIFVAGSSSIFQKGLTIKEATEKLRSCLA